MRARLEVKHIVSDAKQPSLETGQSPELGYIGVCLDKSILCKVVAELNITKRLVKEKPAHRRLVFTNKLVKCLLVAEYCHLRNQ